MKFLLRCLLAALTLLIMISVFAVSLLTTQAGSAWLLRELAAHSQRRISYQNFQGVWLGHFAVTGLQVNVAHAQITISQIDWHWQAIKLLQGDLQVSHVIVNGLQINQELDKLENTFKEPLQIPRLTLPWWLRRLTVGDLQIHNWSFAQQHHIVATGKQAALIANLERQRIAMDVWLEHLVIKSNPKQDDRIWNINSQLHVQGTLQHYQWQFMNEILMPDAKIPSAWNLTGDGNAYQLHLLNISSHHWSKTLTFDALLDWQHNVNLKAKLYGSFNPAIWYAPLKGQLHTDIDFVFNNIGSLAPSFHMAINQLQGKLLNQATSGLGQITWLPNHVTINNLALKVGLNTVNANGEISHASHFNWQININELQHVIPIYSGRIVSQGTMRGDWKTPQLDMNAMVSHLQLGTLKIPQLNAQAAIGGLQQRFQVDIFAKDLRVKNNAIQLLKVKSTGTLLAHQLQADLNSQRGNLSFALQGGYQNDLWQGQLTQLLLAPQHITSWKLKKAVALKISTDLLVMATPACLAQSNQHICMQVDYDAKTKRAIIIDTSALDLKPWGVLLPDNIVFSYGKAQLSANLNFDSHWQPSGDMHLKLWPTMLTYYTNSQQSLPIIISKGNVDASLMNQNAKATALLETNLAKVTAQVRGEHWQSYQADWLNQTIQGVADIHVQNLAWLAKLLPTLQNTQGQLNVHADIAGSLSQPKANITTALSRASAFLVPYNLTLKNIVLTLKGQLDQALQVNGGITSGVGRLAISGQLENILASPAFKLNLKGKNVLLSNLPSYVVWADPDVTLSYQSPNMTLAGLLKIPKAELRIIEYSGTAVNVTRDVVYVDEQNSALNFFTHLVVELGDAIHLKYGGLTGRLVGKLNLTDTPNANTTAVGNIQLVDGSYQAYGQNLAIQHAQASFKGGDVANPTLDVEAAKTLKNVVPITAGGSLLQTANVNPDGSLTVGVRITGPLSNYKAELFSNPPGLSQSDILSYLVLGQPASQAGSGGGQLLLSAASMLSSGNSTSSITKIQDELKNTLGLEVNVGTASQYNPATQSVSQGTALILTKTLSPKLYLSYSMGIGQAINIVNVRYQISRRWMAQTESSSLGNGGDIFYTIDR